MYDEERGYYAAAKIKYTSSVTHKNGFLNFVGCKRALCVPVCSHPE